MPADRDDEERGLIESASKRPRRGWALVVAGAVVLGTLLGYALAARRFAEINYALAPRAFEPTALTAPTAPVILPPANDLLSACRALWRRKEDTHAVAERAWRSRLATMGHTLTSAFVPRRQKWQKSVFDPYEPLWSCEDRERVGAGPRYVAIGDGPKFACGIETIKPPCLVYNIGSNNDISFEQAVHAHTHCEIHTFDPTLRRPYIGGKYSAFHAIGLADRKRTYSGWKMLSLGQMMANLSHVGRRIDILKVDCEGCEWEALPAVFREMQAGRLQVGQLLIEVHSVPVWTRKQWAFFEDAAKAGLRLFSKERNGWGCYGWKCVEFSYVDSLQACRAFTSTHCPGHEPASVCGQLPATILTANNKP